MHTCSYGWCSCGGVLSAEELYKIDNTAMAEVMAEEEEEVEEEAMEEGLGGRERKDGLDKDSELAREKEENTAAVELETILRSCDEIQQKISDQEKVTEAEGGEEVGEGEGEGGES